MISCIGCVFFTFGNITKVLISYAVGIDSLILRYGIVKCNLMILVSGVCNIVMN